MTTRPARSLPAARSTLAACLAALVLAAGCGPHEDLLLEEALAPSPQPGALPAAGPLPAAHPSPSPADAPPPGGTDAPPPGGTDAPPPPTGAPPPGGTDAPPPAPAPGVLLPYELDAEERALLALVNAHRASAGVAPLQPSIALSRAAQFHSDDMAAKNYFSHTLADGTSFSDSIRSFGYTARTAVGENIAAGNADAQRTFEQWKSSAGHNANMLDARFKVIGIGRAAGTASRYRWYWTNTFGGAMDALLDPVTGRAPLAGSP